MKGTLLFVSGIDTNIGKTYATGILARNLAEQGHTVITQKMIQTGCEGLSEDIEMHRHLQGIPLTEEDKAGITCPYLFKYPCAPTLAAEMEGKEIDLSKIDEAIRILCNKYEYVLLEGAGGLMVPCTSNQLTIDFVCERQYPLVLVTNGRLGSINHTLLSLYACQQRGIALHTLVYNLYPKEDDTIRQHTLNYLRQHLALHHPEAKVVLLDEVLGE